MNNPLVQPKKWNLFPPPDRDWISQFPDIPDIILQLLANRNIRSQDDIDEFLNPDYGQDIRDPFLFRDMKKATDRIDRAISGNEPIVVHGDYDADGICASALLVETLSQLGAAATVFLPDREKDGYGLNVNTINNFHESGIRLIITTDCGVSNHSEVSKAVSLGIDVIITDHHTIPQQLPTEAAAIIHPNMPGETYPSPFLSGGGVAWKLACALSSIDHHHRLASGYEKWLLDLAAISTIADMVSLIGESRTIVRYGLIVLQKTKRMGLRLLLDQIKMKRIEPSTISFFIAPRINAAGRMDHASGAYVLLTSLDRSECERIVPIIERQNKDRQMMTDIIVEEARHQTEDQKDQSLIFVHGDDWPSGLLGLIAGKLVQEINRPVIATCTSQGRRRGSGRSVPSINLMQALQTASDLFDHYGGHPQAVGLTVKERFEQSFQNKLRSAVDDQANGQIFQPCINIDYELMCKDITWGLIEKLNGFQPHGMGNPKPLFLTKGVVVVSISSVGNDGQHLRMVVEQQGVRRQAIAFGLGKREAECRLKTKIDIVYEIDVNEYQGTRDIQLKIQDFRQNL